MAAVTLHTAVSGVHSAGEPVRCVVHAIGHGAGAELDYLSVRLRGLSPPPAPVLLEVGGPTIRVRSHTAVLELPVETPPTRRPPPPARAGAAARAASMASTASTAPLAVLVEAQRHARGAMVRAALSLPLTVLPASALLDGSSTRAAAHAAGAVGVDRDEASGPLPPDSPASPLPPARSPPPIEVELRAGAHLGARVRVCAIGDGQAGAGDGCLGARVQLALPPPDAPLVCAAAGVRLLALDAPSGGDGDPRREARTPTVVAEAESAAAGSRALTFALYEPDGCSAVGPGRELVLALELAMREPGAAHGAPCAALRWECTLCKADATSANAAPTPRTLRTPRAQDTAALGIVRC